MMKEILYRDIFLVPIAAGLICQLIKLLIYSVLERRFMPGGLLRPDGMPNIHASVFSALSTMIGLKYGYSSLLYSVAATYSVVILHDTMRVKRAKEKQVDVLNRIILSVKWTGALESDGTRRVLQYRPLDVLGGVMLGVSLSYIVMS
jgi:acid phosphatase family membrane protein YuiD